MVLDEVQIHRFDSVNFTEAELHSGLPGYLVSCVRERLSHLFLVLGTKLALK